MAHTLVLIRHAKSDWSHRVCDEQRPLAPRGRRQAPAVGEWLAHLLALDLVLISPATRARQTWERIYPRLTTPVGQVRIEPGVYTFNGTDLGALVAGIDESVAVAAVVGHNPAMEELVQELTGSHQRMTTASLAMIGMDRWAAPTGALIAVGRPADGPLEVR